MTHAIGSMRQLTSSRFTSPFSLGACSADLRDLLRRRDRLLVSFRFDLDEDCVAPAAAASEAAASEVSAVTGEAAAGRAIAFGLSACFLRREGTGGGAAVAGGVATGGSRTGGSFETSADSSGVLSVDAVPATSAAVCDVSTLFFCCRALRVGGVGVGSNADVVGGSSTGASTGGEASSSFLLASAAVFVFSTASALVATAGAFGSAFGLTFCLAFSLSGPSEAFVCWVCCGRCFVLRFFVLCFFGRLGFDGGLGTVGCAGLAHGPGTATSKEASAGFLS